jgi:hypothetical protein
MLKAIPDYTSPEPPTPNPQIKKNNNKKKRKETAD